MAARTGLLATTWHVRQNEGRQVESIRAMRPLLRSLALHCFGCMPDMFHEIPPFVWRGILVVENADMIPPRFNKGQACSC